MDPELTAERKDALLRLACETLQAHLCGQAAPELPPVVSPGLCRGAFVTLRKRGSLRGCLGRVTGDRPVAEVVRGLTIAAASEDPRFPPVTAEEYADIDIEVSVLSSPVALDPVDPKAIVIGRDGVIVRRGDVSGLLLPQVARERNWSPEQFLTATCVKAGLPRRAWQEPGTEVLTFVADVFGGAG